MLLSEVTTPLERHRVIEYAATGNDTVQHWRELKQVTGPLYMSEPKPDQRGYASYNLYLIFLDIPAGAMYQHDLLRPDLSTVEDLAKEIKDEGVDTPEHFVEHLDRMMRENRKRFVLSKIKDGWRPVKEENQTSWRRVHFEWVESKPRTEYRLVKDNLCYTISKTEYDFACHLVMQSLTAPLDAA